jgi:hypothetical protein
MNAKKANKAPAMILSVEDNPISMPFCVSYGMGKNYRVFRIFPIGTAGS